MEKPEETQQVFLGYLSDYVPASEDSTDVYNPKVGGHPVGLSCFFSMSDRNIVSISTRRLGFTNHFLFLHVAFVALH